MKKLMVMIGLMVAVCTFQSAYADDYQDALKEFRQSPAVSPYFKSSYGYAIFPSIGKGAVGVGGAYGKGRVYKGGVYVGDISMTQVSIGWQLGGQTFRELIFLEDKATFDKFIEGNFGFDAQASAVAISVGAGAQAGSSGASANAGDKQSKAVYVNGMTIFSMQNGGLMYEAAVAGQKFTYTPATK